MAAHRAKKGQRTVAKLSFELPQHLLVVFDLAEALRSVIVLDPLDPLGFRP
ncbi:MAG: hypothetical protein U0263_16925 [Polyangiaceae bacterium]